MRSRARTTRWADFAAAKPLYLKTLRIYEQSVGPADSRLGPPLSNLARVQSHLGEDDRAIASARRALEIVEAARGPDHIELPTLWAGLGHVYTRAGKFSDAADAHRRALALRRKLRGDDHAETAYSQRSLAEALRRLGRPREALPPARQAAETIEDRLGEEHPQLASALLTLGRVEQDLDRIADARQHLERALRVYAVAEAPPTEIAEAKFALARVVAESPGERAYATRLADEADAVLAESWLDARRAPRSDRTGAQRVAIGRALRGPLAARRPRDRRCGHTERSPR